ncbi:NifB/NifX family molybdenum-iron cluster-binding protein [Clostridium algidicarnis]|uniref:Putative Fe-Mo cluster-binding NifX family protein n=1 Tax=Clostridium algidicarnis DSM 15099 TaxID=1121295 RepID=A0A2S6FZU1_9CLOT|nr:NifB/NifX family molybdenum-iron cluster-binding protein [Clostridium algidicarnis]MBB6630917.1 NifB/NifX family molybdenum-iron cluster-binding protein [Clostridium algidicarnis]MBB6696822.1 NifB/NifX family molybdenum-iron cluster-binding protein [Clostridium algidicarnis]MCB2286125.1 NifB/NifX family molybdenum-iron cluster-binding protein [Clostridium algidicarnis]PPK49158.1 putative Fe-Mo cluster-binding NifX family protein [Clostridium algidicarnis DSM 15099]
MKIAMPKNGELINQHFGKSESFLVVTMEEGKIIDKKEISALKLQHNHGGLSNLLLDEGVSLIITGGIGAGAYNALKENNLEVIRGVNGKIEEVLLAYLKGELEDKNVVCNHNGEHHNH